MATNFPTALDSYDTLVDNVDNIIAAHPNDRGDAIEALQAKVGIDSSVVATAHDYLLRRLPAQDANWDAGGVEVRAQTLQADVATGTAPLTIVSTTKVDNLNADKVDDKDAADFLLKDGTISLTADWNAGSYLITALRYASTQGTGTAPLTVASTTKVTNLNADKVDDADVDTDVALTANSDTKIASQKAVKTYADGKISKTTVGEINAMDEKETLHANDLILIEDSEASNAKKKAKKSAVAPAKDLGSLVDKSSSYGAQQATTDGFVLAYTAIGCENKYLSGFTDAEEDPTTRVAYFDLRGAYNSGRGNMNIMFPVKKNDYWKVTTDATISKVYWIPLGS